MVGGDRVTVRLSSFPESGHEEEVREKRFLALDVVHYWGTGSQNRRKGPKEGGRAAALASLPSIRTLSVPRRGRGGGVMGGSLAKEREKRGNHNSKETGEARKGSTNAKMEKKK